MAGKARGLPSPDGRSGVVARPEVRSALTLMRLVVRAVALVDNAMQRRVLAGTSTARGLMLSAGYLLVVLALAIAFPDQPSFAVAGFLVGFAGLALMMDLYALPSLVAAWTIVQAEVSPGALGGVVCVGAGPADFHAAHPAAGPAEHAQPGRSAPQHPGRGAGHARRRHVSRGARGINLRYRVQPGDCRDAVE